MVYTVFIFTYHSNHRNLLYSIIIKNATKKGYINITENKHNIIEGDIMFKVDNELKSANIPRTVRFTEPLFEKLNKTAAENGISFNLLVLQCCKYALDDMRGNDTKK